MESLLPLLGRNPEFVVPAMAAALVFGIWTLLNYRKLKRLERWGAAKGKIVWSQVEIVEHFEHLSRPNYRPDIRYTYRVGRDEYEGVRVIGSSVVYKWESQVQQVLDRYPPGKEVLVRYDPDAPIESLLELPNSRQWLVLLGFTLLLLIATAAAYFL